jgi:hypothetical protein
MGLIKRFMASGMTAEQFVRHVVPTGTLRESNDNLRESLDEFRRRHGPAVASACFQASDTWRGSLRLRHAGCGFTARAAGFQGEAMSTMTDNRPTINVNDGNRIDNIRVQPHPAVHGPADIKGFRVNLDSSEPGQRVSYARRIERVVGATTKDGAIVASIAVNPGHESAAALLYDVANGVSSFTLRIDARAKSADLIVGDAPAQQTAAVAESADLIEDSTGGPVVADLDYRRQLLRNPARILSSWRRQHLTY